MNRITMLLLAGVTITAVACGNDQGAESANENANAPAASEQAMPAQPAGEQPTGAAADAVDLARDAASVLQTMKMDQNLRQLIDQSKGLFIVPNYGRGAAVVGARGGQGVLIGHENGQWSSPVFYDVGGVSVGAEFGGEGGSIAMLLMTDKALNSFKGNNTFSFNAGADFTIVDYSTATQASAGKGDVILWSDTKGAFAGASLSVTELSWDRQENQAYYGPTATAQEILSGQATSQYSNPLQQAVSDL